MIVFRNPFYRYFTPILKIRTNKNYNISWKIHKRNQSDYHGHFICRNIVFQQFRSVHISTSYNKVISFKLSDIGEGIRDVIVKEWYVKEGDRVEQFENICEVQSDKASVTITSRYDGIIKKLYHNVDDIALVGQPLIDIDTFEENGVVDGNENSKIEEQINMPSQNNSTKRIIPDGNQSSDRGIAIPSVRRIAKEHNVGLNEVEGTGKDGRILKEDVLNYVNRKTEIGSKNDNIDIQPVRGYTRSMIKTMTEAMKIPHFLYCDEIRVTKLVKLREKLRRKSSEINVKITYLPFFIKATSNALLRYPLLNARLDDTQENIIFYKSHNISIAMDTSTGLAVPVIKNVQDKSIIEISKDIIRLQELGKESKFSKEDLSDGTFTFSNIGAIGGTYAKPVILPPQSAIIALGAFQDVPRFSDDGSIKRETLSFISGAADHRIIDGATMAKFCNFLKDQIENPEFLFLNI